jgi:hypothetical protein
MRYTFLEFCMSQESCPQDLDSPSSDIESNAFKQKCDGVNEILGFVMIRAKTMFLSLFFEVFSVRFAFFFGHGHWIWLRY